MTLFHAAPRRYFIRRCCVPLPCLMPPACITLAPIDDVGNEMRITSTLMPIFHASPPIFRSFCHDAAGTSRQRCAAPAALISIRRLLLDERAATIRHFLAPALSAPPARRHMPSPGLHLEVISSGFRLFARRLIFIITDYFGRCRASPEVRCSRAAREALST